MFDQLKSLLKAGAAAPAAPAPTPEPVAVVPAPAPSVASLVENIPPAPVAVTPEPAPAVEAAPAVAPDNSGISNAAPVEVVPVPAAAPVNSVVPEPVRDPNQPEVFTRPVDEAEEAREDLPPRSRERIAWLLESFEKDRRDLTEKRIFNDKMRWRNANPPVTVSPYREPGRNPQAHLVSPEK